MEKASRFYSWLSLIRKPASSLLSYSPNYRHKKISEGLKSPDLPSLYKNLMTGVRSPLLTKANLNTYQLGEQFLNNDNDLISRMCDYDIKTYLNGDINTKVDRASMAYSLETRSPFQDYRIVEFARSLPTKFKYSNRVGKLILKELLYELVPQSFFDRPKSGFAVPLERWFRDELKTYVLDHLNMSFLKSVPYLNATLAEQYIDNHINSKANHSAVIWNLLMYKNWLESTKN